MDGEKKYEAFSIPHRKAPPAKGVVSHAQIGPFNVVLSTDAPFAEIEYEHDAKKAVSSPPAQPVGSRKADPVRDRFYGMRSLVSGAPFARNDPRLFYQQARYMEDFTDEYAGKAQFFMYYPSYQHMGYAQLRTYFTWRALARRGEFPPIPLSYVFLHIYELLCGIGVTDPMDGLQKLLAIWAAYRQQAQALNGYLPEWLKDYHIYYALPHSFADFVNEHRLERYYPDPLLRDPGSEEGFALWSSLSSYDVAKSKFCGEGNDVMMRDCFSAVFSSIADFCVTRGCLAEDLLISGVRKAAPWSPFQRALFHPWLDQPDRQVAISAREVYACQGNRWTADIPVPCTDQKEFIGYLMKKTEACLRQTVKYKYKITANPHTFCNMAYKLGQLKITLPELDAAIEKAVADFYKDLNRTVVTVDYDNLKRIRSEALDTQDKLIVPEDDPLSASAATPAEEHAPLMASLPASTEADSGFDGWAALKDTLNPMESAAMSMILRGGKDIKAFADQNGIMLEVLVDTINEKATDCIGDSIMELEDDILLYDDYKEKIAEMIG